MALNWQQMMDYVNSNQSLEDRYRTSEGWLDPASGLNPMYNADSYTYRSYNMPGMGLVQYDPDRQAFNTFDGGQYNVGGAGQNYTQYGKDGSVSQKQSVQGTSWMDGIPVDKIVPVMMAVLGGAAAAGAGAGGAAAGAGEGAAGAGAGWTSGFDLAGGGALGEGAAAGAGAGASAADTIANAVANAGGTQAGGGMTQILDSLPSGLKDLATSKAGSAIVGGLLSGLSGKNAPNNLTSTSQAKLDPRMDAFLYGSNGVNGLLGQVLANGYSPQSAGMSQFGTAMDNYLKNWGEDNFAKSQQAAQGLQNSNISAPTTGAAQVDAPSQNNIDLTGSYNDFIYGSPGANPYLTGAIQKGINQSNNAFGNMMTDATRNLNENVLPSIRSGAVLNNTMGSSRQGIAESRALNDYSTQMGRALSQFGQNNTDAAVAAQAGAYDTDRNRALAATQGLGAQQYGVAQQNAQMQQQANLANLQSQLSMNQLNSNNQQAGIGLSSGLLNQAYGYGANADSYGLNKAGKTAGLLGGFTGYNQSQNSSQPLYSSTAGNILGGALGGLALWNGFNQPATKS
jgi:hypothetical protein